MRFLPPLIVKAIRLLTALLIIRVTIAVVSNYRNYLPPNFRSDFLSGREGYFYGPYQWAFYTHIFAGPFTLIAGLLLLSNRFRVRFPQWHRYLGRAQVMVILLMILPSGLWMSYYAASGRVATVGFAALSVATATTAAFGWRTAVQRRFKDHQTWMIRCYLMLCSAVVLRLTAGAAVVSNYPGEWIYPASAWTSWVLPLAAYELSQKKSRLGKFKTPPLPQQELA